MQLLVIEVLGVPQVSPHDRISDQLKIHFLKRRNSGGDVLIVIYPTSTPGQAYVVFDSDKVPGVLKCAHLLDVNNQFYPISVKEADLSEVDMPVKTCLMLSMFPNQESIIKLLQTYDFTMTEDISGQLQLKGSFLKLKLVRAQLIQLLFHTHQLKSSSLHNGSSLEYELEHESRRNGRNMHAVGQQELLVSTLSSLSSQSSGSSGSPRIPQSHHFIYDDRNVRGRAEAVDEEYHKQDRKEPVLSHGWRPCADGASPDPTGLNPRQQYRDSASTKNSIHAADTMHTSHEDSDFNGSLRRLNSDASSSFSNGGISSFPVATDVINFIQTQNKSLIQKIREMYGTKMTVEVNAEVATVSFSGKNSKKAEAHLLNIIHELSPLLRTQEIYLKNYDRTKQQQILDRITCNQDHGVMITQCEDIIKLVGSSKQSFEMMQVILGHNDELLRGRPMERGSKIRRSSSLPRQYKMTQHSFGADPKTKTISPIKYNPSQYQEKADERKAPQIGPSLERTCSKNMEQRIHQDTDLPTSSPGKKSKNKYLKKVFDSRLSQVLPIKNLDIFSQKHRKY